MANAGTWLVGRLQTENDKARVLEGLRSAAGGTDVGLLDRAIGGLGKRQFLLVQPIAGDVTAFPVKDEAIGTVPVFDDVEPLIDLASEGFLMQIAAEKGGFHRAA